VILGAINSLKNFIIYKKWLLNVQSQWGNFYQAILGGERHGR
jgi:hypothetical protein